MYEMTYQFTASDWFWIEIRQTLKGIQSSFHAGYHIRYNLNADNVEFVMLTTTPSSSAPTKDAGDNDQGRNHNDKKFG